MSESTAAKRCSEVGCGDEIGRGGAQGKCRKHYQKWWRDKNKDKIAAYKITGRAQGWQRKSHLQRNYGITVEQYDEMLLDQNGCCAICGSSSPGSRYPSFYVDHDHNSGEVRGLLCHFCNFGLGAMRDDPEILVRAAGYIRSFQ